MADNKLSEGVGKKIVEALKKQSEIEINPISNEDSQEGFMEETDFLDNLSDNEFSETEDDNEESSFSIEEPASIEEPMYQQALEFTQPSAQSYTYQQPLTPMVDNFVSELDTFEIPSNIAALKKLITQLPAGVSRQTGAQIIRQTMEALGISMKGVLQEAQQVQDGLSTSAKECQNSIAEYKKQILALEKQCQNHQRQYSALNELISLFIQTGR